MNSSGQLDGQKQASLVRVPELVTVSGPGLALRTLALDLLRWVYPIVTALIAGIGLAVGGWLWVVLRWLKDEIDIQNFGDVVRTLGGVWILPQKPRRLEDLGLALTRSEAPVLFDEILRLSRLVGSRPPAQVYLTYLPCCGVIDRNQRGRSSALLVGLPLLEVLNQPEMQAVLVHELTHLAHGDASRTSWSVEFLDILSESLNRQERAAGFWERLSPLRLWAIASQKLARVCLEPVLRGQEARADAAAAAIAGGTATASALVKTALVQPIFREVLDAFDAHTVGNPNLYTLFRKFWTRLPEELLTSMRHRILSCRRQEPPLTAYPPLLDRVSSVQNYPTRPHQTPDGPATHLLGDVDHFEKLLHARLFGLERPEPSVFHRVGS